MSSSAPPHNQLALARRVARASFIGTTIEWYDFFIYATAAALVFGPQFFPSDSALASTLAAYSTFAVGFIARPIGGIVMGHFGDRVGRKQLLVFSLLLMGAATFLIGLLPELRDDRRLGAGAAGAAAVRAGHRRRRRVGRRGAHGRRARTRRASGPSTAPSRRWACPPASSPRTLVFLIVGQFAGPRGVRRMGMADPVPALGRPRAVRAGHPAADHGVARSSPRCATVDRWSANPSSRSPAATPSNCCSPAQPASPLRRWATSCSSTCSATAPPRSAFRRTRCSH